jgi:hypothetical protein
MNWRALIYPLFHGYPRVIVINRSRFRYEEKERHIPFMGEAVQGGFIISPDSIREWHYKDRIQPLSDQEKKDVQEVISNELRSLGYSVTMDNLR